MNELINGIWKMNEFILENIEYKNNDLSVCVRLWLNLVSLFK